MGKAASSKGTGKKSLDIALIICCDVFYEHRNKSECKITKGEKKMIQTEENLERKDGQIVGKVPSVVSDLFFNHSPAERAYDEEMDGDEGKLLEAAKDFICLVDTLGVFTPEELVADFHKRVTG